MNVYTHIEVEIDAHKMWNNLKELYEPKNVQNKVFV